MAQKGLGVATLVAQRLPPHEQLGRLRGLGKYETQRLKLDEAARLANIDLGTFADACVSRKIRVYWYRAEDVQSDLETLKKEGLVTAPLVVSQFRLLAEFFEVLLPPTVARESASESRANSVAGL